MWRFSVFICVCLVLSHVESHSDDWDIFTFAQEWPRAVCEMGKHEHHHCVIPDNVFSWGIHGLWPTKKGTHGPTSCNRHLYFNASNIQSIVPKLEMLWPNMYADTSFTSFWEHEWSKHGTCASSLPATANEFLYFNKALTLMSRYDAGKLLKNEHISPSTTQKYTLNELTLALTRSIGAKPNIECTKDWTTGKDMIYEVEICLDKNFNPVDCYELPYENNSNGHESYNPKSNCPHTDLIEYPPICFDRRQLLRSLDVKYTNRLLVYRPVTGKRNTFYLRSLAKPSNTQCSADLRVEVNTISIVVKLCVVKMGFICFIPIVLWGLQTATHV